MTNNGKLHTTSVEQRRNEFARNYINEKDEYRSITICECPVCGHLEWVCSAKADTFNYKVEEMFARECKTCLEAFTRAPEVTNWILNVIEYQLRELIK